MRTKTPHFVVTFHTTAEAMATERLCKTLDLPGRLIPVPRAITADCGIAWSAPPEAAEKIRAALQTAGVETAGDYELLL